MEQIFGRWLRRGREALRLSRTRLAEQVPCSIETIRKLESGERHASPQLAARLADILAVPPADLPAFMHAASTGTLPPTLAEHAVAAREIRSWPNLPAPLTLLIGRSHDLATIRSRLVSPSVRLLTLVGPPGVGKSRLSLAVAADLVDYFEDGVVFVALAPLRDTGLVPTTIASTLGIAERSQDGPAALRSYLHRKHMLLVLDNFEQVVEAGPQVVDLLQKAPELKVLVTSRVVLHVSGEHVYPVPPLEVPDLRHLPSFDRLAECASIALFDARARAARPDFILTHENTAAVAEICVRVDGLPLAIELAAARSRLLAPQLLLERLSSRMLLLTGGPEDLAPRLQALHSAIAWSYDLLNPDEQTLFARLSVFAGGFTLSAATAICQLDERPFDVLDRLQSLIDKSLVHPVHPAYTSMESEQRFAMLETIREYALEQLVARGEADELHRRHAAFFLNVAETAERSQQLIWLEQLELEHDNLRASLTWAVSSDSGELAQRLTGALWWFWLGYGHTTEGRRWLDSALQLPDTVPPLVRANAVLGSGRLALAQHEPERARMLLETSLSLFEMVGRDEDVAWTLLNLAVAAAAQRERSLARRWLDDSLTWFRRLGNPRGIAWVLIERAQMALEEGDSEGALCMLDEAASGVRASDDQHVIAWLLHHRGRVELTRANFRTAHSCIVESLAWFRDQRTVRGIVANLEVIAQVWGADILAAPSDGERNVRGDRTAGEADPAGVGGSRVAWLLGKAEVLRDLSGLPVAPADRSVMDRLVTRLRGRLGDTDWALAWAEGRDMDLDQVIACAITG